MKKSVSHTPVILMALGFAFDRSKPPPNQSSGYALVSLGLPIPGEAEILFSGGYISLTVKEIET